jgi:hypothetical protein
MRFAGARNMALGKLHKEKETMNMNDINLSISKIYLNNSQRTRKKRKNRK